ncbi:DUF3238 domain-containing protein [Filibacter tadaridae]|uniref:DUF3238 domain-containing protein n=1 Tax=Filibacter tadaridae TaxID=2483811 RepID=A0A3P5WCS3_9BACL|nr:DUF3238 domain-containing protein [Filibacter tadaridae]VDC18207.1 hypothetical protein FILTAD_00128 [Filibacter tadaridae]
MNKLAFEIKTVTHVPDSISFTWNDTGGVYKVYRNGKHVYEGTAPEFSDGDIKHAKMYNYTIERIENDNVVDVIALQTSAFAEKKDKESPLQSLVLTTIVAKTQIALSWEEIQDVEDYAIYRNGTLMNTTGKNYYIDRDFSLDEGYTYAIHSTRPLAKSEERMNISNSVISKVFGTLNPFSSKEEATDEEFIVTKLIAEPKELLTPVAVRKRKPNIDRWRFRYTTFLPDEWVRNPNVLSPNHYFKGDGRGFDVNGKSYRTRVDINLAYDLDGAPLTVTKGVGESVAYSHLKRVRQKETAPSEGIVLKRMDHRKEETGFLLTHAVGNPLTTAPEIDYEVKSVMRRDGTFDMTGYHNQAPHHEIYMMRGDQGNWIPLHQAESKGLAYMSNVVAWQYWRVSSFG